MKFYAREKELQCLQKQYRQVDGGSLMTVLVGRRRIGKTLLAQTFVKDKKHFLSRLRL